MAHTATDASISALVVLRHGHPDAPFFRPTARAIALRAMAPSTLENYVRTPGEALDKLISILAGLPAFEYFNCQGAHRTRACFEALAEELEG